MDACISKGKAVGRVTVPPSKSLTHRGLICGALAWTEAGDATETGAGTVIFPLYNSEDILTTIDCLRELGAIIKIEGSKAYVEKGISPSKAQRTLNCRESGSTLRFLIPLCLALGIPAKFTGSSRLFQRPMGVYEDLCRKQGVMLKKDDESIIVDGKIHGNSFTIPANISSQFVSGLLLALPLLKGERQLIFSTKAESMPYILLTLDTMKRFGINVLADLKNGRITIGAEQKYGSPGIMEIEGDYSGGAFLDSLNYLGGKVSLLGLDKDSLQGDKVYKEYFKAIKKGCPTLDISDCPDLGPILMALGAANKGVTLTGTERLKYKESDRGNAMALELLKFGARVDIEKDRITVESSGLVTPKDHICTHNDHRVAMALSVLCTLTGGTIKDCNVVAKSFPDFYEILSGLGIQITFN